MYRTMRLDGKYFIYFWTSRNTAINGDRTSGVFAEPFRVSEDNCKEWRVTSRKDMIAPELLTYWEI